MELPDGPGFDRLCRDIAAAPDPATAAHDAEEPHRSAAIRAIMAARSDARELLIAHALIEAFSRGRISGINEVFDGKAP